MTFSLSIYGYEGDHCNLCPWKSPDRRRCNLFNAVISYSSRRCKRCRELEQKMTTGQPLTSIQNVEDPATQLDALMADNMQDRLAKYLDECKLTQRERNVLIMRFGLDEQEPRTFDYIAKLHHVTTERIRQVFMKAIARMQIPYRAKKLRKDLGL